MTHPSDEVRIYGDERRHQEMVTLQNRIILLLGDVLEALDARPRVVVPPFPEMPAPATLDVTALVEEIVARLPEDRTGEITQAFAETVKQLERLNKKVTGLSVMPSGGSSGHVIVDSGNIALSQPVDVSDRQARQLGQVTFPAGTSMEVANDTGNPIPVSSSTLATETTLDAMRDFLTATRSTVYGAVAGVATSTWTTVLSHTPAVAQLILGLNCERTAGLTNITYRYRLRVNDASVIEEGINVNSNSWIQMETSVAAGQTVIIQALHGELAVQDFNASLNVRNMA